MRQSPFVHTSVADMDDEASAWYSCYRYSFHWITVIGEWCVACRRLIMLQNRLSCVAKKCTNFCLCNPMKQSLFHFVMLRYLRRASQRSSSYNPFKEQRATLKSASNQGFEVGILWEWSEMPNTFAPVFHKVVVNLVDKSSKLMSSQPWIASNATRTTSLYFSAFV